MPNKDKLGDFYTSNNELGINSTMSFGNSSVNSSINATSIYVGTALIANSTGPYGKTEGNLNVNNAVTVTTNTSTNTFQIGTAAYFTSAGRLGIGTSNPQGPLHVNGTVSFLTSNVAYTPQLVAWSQTPDATGAYYIIDKSRSAAGANVAVGDTIGALYFRGYDTTNTVRNSSYVGATVTAVNSSAVDSAISLIPSSYLVLGANNVEYARLVANGNFGIGNSAPSTKFSVNGTGYFGSPVYIGATPASGVQLYLGGNYPSTTDAYGLLTDQTVSSTTTGSAAAVVSNPSTAASAFTLSALNHFVATQGTIGAGSAVTNQRGFYAFNTLTGATNNYGFYSDIAFGSNRWNFYASGTAYNFFQGAVGFGNGPTAYTQQRIGGTGPSSSSLTYSVYADQTAPATTTSEFASFYSIPNTTASAFTLGTLFHFVSNQGTIGAGSAVTNQFGFYAASNMTGATNNYGFYSNLAAGTGRYNFYAAGTAVNYFAGNTGIGNTAPTNTLSVNGSTYLGGQLGINISAQNNVQLQMGGTAVSGSATSYPVYIAPTIPSTTTAGASYFTTSASTQAAAFTLTNLQHFFASQGTIGAGSTVTNQFGFFASATLVGATNDYGFYGEIPAGTGRYNFYAAGTADNYFAGNTGIGNTAPVHKLSVNGISYFGNTVILGPAGGGNEGGQIDWSAGNSSFNTWSTDIYTSAYRLFTTGNLGNGQVQMFSSNASHNVGLYVQGNTGIGTSAPAYKLDVSGTAHITGAVTLDTALTVGSGGTGATTITGLVKGNGTSAFTAAVAGTDYLTSSVQPAFSAYQSTAQPSITASTWTKIRFQTEDFDTANCFDNATNYRFTPNVAGYYMINGCVGFNVSPVQTWVGLYKNGTIFKRSGFAVNINSGSNYIIVSSIVFLNGSTDYVEIYGFCSSAFQPFATTEQTWFNGCLVRTS